MFKNLEKEMQRLAARQSISVPLEGDAEGYFDKECPDNNCLFQFKIYGQDWKDIVRDEEVFCPSCRHCAPSNSWYTTEQLAGARQYAVNAAKAGINRAMRADAAASKRRQARNSVFSITLKVKGGHEVALLPVSAAAPMRLKTKCEKCQCRYSYVGAAFFCPSCGANSASHTFDQTLTTIRAAAQVGDTLRGALDADQAETLTRSLLEKGMQDTVMSFQRLCEQLYDRPDWPKARRNAFQNLDAGCELWGSAIGVRYDQLLSATEMSSAMRYFQQRHLLAHQQGMVDADYVSRSGDSTYTPGQRLIIKPAAVLAFVDIIEKLGRELMARTS